MSNTLANTTSLLAKAAVEITWQQWGALGAQTNDIRPAHQAVLDPEALLLVSLALLEHERRLADVIASWVSVNSSLLSVQRVKNLSRNFPIPVQQLLHAVAATAIQDGKTCGGPRSPRHPPNPSRPGTGRSAQSDRSFSPRLR
jgi:hypothetical protein